MLRQLLRDTAVYGVAAILARAGSILLLPLYARLLSERDIGALDLMTVAIGLVNVTVALEVAQGLARLLPEADDPEAHAAYANTAFWFTVIGYTLFAGVGLLAAPAVDAAFLGGGYEREVRIAVLSGWAGGILLIIVNQLRYELRPRTYALVTLTSTGVAVALAVAFVAVLRLGLAGVLFAQLSGAVVALTVGLAVTRRGRRVAVDRAKLAEMLAFSVPLVPSSLAVFVMLSIDRIVINQSMSLADVGVFGVGYRIAQVVGLLMVGFQLAMTPLIYRRYREAGTPAELARIFRYFSALALTACLGLSLFGGHLVSLFATDRYGAATRLIPLLAAAVLLANMYVFAPGLAIARRSKSTALLSIGAAILNTVLNLVLVPVLGLVGAATATLTATATLFGVTMVMSQREYFVPHGWGRLGLALGTTLALILVGTWIPDAGWAGLVARAACLAAACVAFVAIGLVRIQDLRSGWRAVRGGLAS